MVIIGDDFCIWFIVIVVLLFATLTKRVFVLSVVVVIEFVNEYDIFKKAAVKSARIIHENHSWSSVADMILDRLSCYEKRIAPK